MKSFYMHLSKTAMRLHDRNFPAFQKLVKNVVDAVDLPVTVKTRIGWDVDSINILDVAKRIEDAGAAALTIHCRTKTQGHSGEPDWSWISRIKEVVKIPVALNGGVFTAEDAYIKIKLGASLVQLITGMVYEGPQLISEINYGLVKLLKKDGFKNISEAVGVDSKIISKSSK